MKFCCDATGMSCCLPHFLNVWQPQTPCSLDVKLDSAFRPPELSSLYCCQGSHLQQLSKPCIADLFSKPQGQNTAPPPSMCGCMPELRMPQVTSSQPLVAAGISAICSTQKQNQCPASQAMKQLQQCQEAQLRAQLIHSKTCSDCSSNSALEYPDRHSLSH